MRAAIVLGGGRSTRMGTDKLALERDGLTLLAHTCRAAGRFAERVVVAGHEQPELDVEFVLEDPPFGGPVAGIAAAVEFLAAVEGFGGPSSGPAPSSLGPAQGPAVSEPVGGHGESVEGPAVSSSGTSAGFGGPSSGPAPSSQGPAQGPAGSEPAGDHGESAQGPAGSEPEVLVLAGDLANPEAVVELLAHAEMGTDGVVLEDHEGWPQYLAGRYRLAALQRAVERAGDVRDLSVRRFLRAVATNQVPAPEATTADIDTPESAVTWGVTGFLANQKVSKINYDDS